MPPAAATMPLNETSMKYIIWDLINERDGYTTTECETWDEVCVAMKTICGRIKHGGDGLYEKWATGKIKKFVNKGSMEVFVTSEPISSPIS